MTQSQDSGHAAAPTDELRGLADWLCAEASKLDDAPWRNDPIVLSHVLTLRNWAKAVRALALRSALSRLDAQ